jgi:hypothetical protein
MSRRNQGIVPPGFALVRSYSGDGSYRLVPHHEGELSTRSHGPKTKSIPLNVDQATYDLYRALSTERGISMSKLYEADLISRGGPSGVNGVRVTPGEYLASLFRSNDPNAPRAVREEAETLLRTVAETGTADAPGALPFYLTGDLVAFVDASRPLVGSMRSLPMPTGGKTFGRAHVTQRTAADAQVEKAQLSSVALQTTGDTITKATHGVVLNLTEQELDWTDPAMLQGVIEDLAESYALKTEAVAASAIVTAASTTVANNDPTFSSSGDTHTAIVAGITSVRSTSKRQADTLYLSGTRWEALAGMVDGDGRPVYDLDEGIAGLECVYSPGFGSSDVMVVAASRLCEVFEDNKGSALSPIIAQLPVRPSHLNAQGQALVVPSALEAQIVYRGYFATNVYAQGLCSIT